MSMSMPPRFMLLAAALAGLASVLPAAGAPGDAVRVVILPIEVHSADPDTGYVSRGLSDMLAARLEQTGRVAIRQVEDPAAVTTRLDEALRRGREQGGDYVLFGSFTQFGDGASLDVRCAPLAAGNEAEAAAARRIFIQSGTMGEIIPKLDEIVDRVAIYMQVVPDPAAAEASAAPAADGRPAARLDADRLRELAERLEALEEAVFDGAARTGEAAPES